MNLPEIKVSELSDWLPDQWKIHHLVWSQSKTGEQWPNDDSSVTSADAQAFKRAWSCFGLDRHFYDVPGTCVDPSLDQIADIKTLQHIVLGLEELAGPIRLHAT